MSVKVKRSRIGRSSSQGDIGMFDQINPIDSPTIRWDKRSTVQNPSKISKPTILKSDQQPRRKILTIGSPVKDDDLEKKVQGPFGGFFEACYYCKKKIEEKDDIFMYSYLRAFCSPKCRYKQIELDKEPEKNSAKSNSTESGSMPWKMNGRNAAQTGKSEFPMFQI